MVSGHSPVSKASKFRPLLKPLIRWETGDDGG